METQWKPVADLLRQARAEMRPDLSREAFASERGGSSRIMADLETAARSNYDVQTLANAEVWYGLQPGQIGKVLEAVDAVNGIDAHMAQVRAELDEAIRSGDSAAEELIAASLAGVQASARSAREVLHDLMFMRRSVAPAVTGAQDDPGNVMLDLPEEAYSDLAPHERAEAIAAAKAAFLQRAREIRGKA